MNTAVNKNTAEKERIDFAQVKLEVPLDYFFTNVLGLKPKKMQSSFRYAGCPSCGVSENAGSVRCQVKGNKWTCYSCGNFGDVIDAAQHFYGYSQYNAAKALMEMVGSLKPAKVHNFRLKTDPQLEVAAQVKNRNAEVKEVINRLLEAQKNFELLDKKVIEHLTQDRAISLDVLKEAHQQGLLIILPFNPSAAKTYLVNVVGRDLLEAAGMWKKESRSPSIVYRPLGLVMCGRAVEFRRIRPAVNENEAKYVSYGPMTPFFLKGDSSNRFVVVEGAIDLLSIPSFDGYSGSSVIGLPGAGRYKPDWFKRMAGKQIIFALDPDEAGTKALYGNPEIPIERRRAGLIEIANEVGAEHKIFSFPENYCSTVQLEKRDINDFLQWTKKASL